MIPSNATFQEVLTYHAPAGAEEFARELEVRFFNEDHEVMITSAAEETQERREELLGEQIYFARELLDGIIDVLKTETRSPKLIRDRILTIISNSMFER
jgi:hypothetical protein